MCKDQIGFCKCVTSLLVSILAALVVQLPFFASTGDPAGPSVAAGKDGRGAQEMVGEPPPRWGHSMALVGEEAYVFGGAASVSSLNLEGIPAPELGALLNDLWKFNFDENNWNEVRPDNTPPTARAWNAFAAYDNSRFYIFWGLDSSGNRIDDIRYLVTGPNIWTPAPSTGEVKPPASAGSMAATIGGDIYVFGGFPNESGMWTYRPSDGRWVEKQWFEQWVPQRACMVPIGSSIYIFGGMTDSYQNALWKYDTVENAWSNPAPQAPIPARRVNCAWAKDNGGDSFWIFGGEGEGFEPLRDVWEYSVPTNTWTRWPDLPDVRIGGAAVGIPGKTKEFLIFGGYRGAAPIAETYVYKPCVMTCNATASPASGEAPLTVQFNGDFTVTGCPSGSPAAKWDFGDGTFAEGTSASHTYQNPGTYSWTFTVELGAWSCVKRGEISVTPNPCYLFCSVIVDPEQGQAPIYIKFISSIVSSNCTGERSILWDFGDGTTSQEENPEHRYAKGGVYNWRFEVKIGSKSCINEGTITLTGLECTLQCQFEVGPSSGRAPLPVSFFAQLAPDNCSTTPTARWDFGDGTTNDQPGTTHTYTAPGTYTYTFHAEVDGQSCDRTGTITVLPPCLLACDCSVAPTSGKAPLNVHFDFTFSSENCEGDPALLLVTGDDSSYGDAKVDHTYQKAGTYEWAFGVTLAGKICTKTGTITVTPALPGDGNGDGQVSIGEVQQGINMFLGSSPPANGVDCNGDGQVSIGEVQKVIVAFLGLPASC